tara:strand:+ start:298 stop:618 length:321 start_codon:yes stop_codon:yes gene_type:complete
MSHTNHTTPPTTYLLRIQGVMNPANPQGVRLDVRVSRIPTLCDAILFWSNRWGKLKMGSSGSINIIEQGGSFRSWTLDEKTSSFVIDPSYQGDPQKPQLKLIGGDA